MQIQRIIKQLRDTWRQFSEDQSGVGVVEIILILVILIGLVLIFKTQITSVLTSAFGYICQAISITIKNIVQKTEY